MKINMGCGWRNFGDDWIHIDGGEYDHVQYQDLFNIPLKEETVDLIYASHVLEYFDEKEVLDALKEWNRVLKKNGILRIAVPDFESISSLYVSGKFKLKNFLGPLYGKMKMGNKNIYHKTCYDFQTLKQLLENNGFQDVKKYDWRMTEHSNFDDHSQAYLPHMDKKNGVLISLNVECLK